VKGRDVSFSNRDAIAIRSGKQRLHVPVIGVQGIVVGDIAISSSFFHNRRMTMPKHNLGKMDK